MLNFNFIIILFISLIQSNLNARESLEELDVEEKIPNLKSSINLIKLSLNESKILDNEQSAMMLINLIELMRLEINQVRLLYYKVLAYRKALSLMVITAEELLPKVTYVQSFWNQIKPRLTPLDLLDKISMNLDDLEIQMSQLKQTKEKTFLTKLAKIMQILLDNEQDLQKTLEMDKKDLEHLQTMCMFVLGITDFELEELMDLSDLDLMDEEDDELKDRNFVPTQRIEL